MLPVVRYRTPIAPRFSSAAIRSFEALQETTPQTAGLAAQRFLFAMRAQGVTRFGKLAEGNRTCCCAAASFLRSIAEGNATIHLVAAGLRALRWVAADVLGWIAEGNATDRWTVASVFRWKAASVNRWIAEGPGVAERSGATPGSVQRVVSQAFAERLARTGACTGENTQP